MTQYWDNGYTRFFLADAGQIPLPDNSIHCVVTSPPYWKQRDYKVQGQIGRETTPQEYIAKLVKVFQDVRRVLRPDGTLWLNMGDKYAFSGGGPGGSKPQSNVGSFDSHNYAIGFKPLDLCMIPARLAIALQDDGWYLRSEIIWNKPSPMPESVDGWRWERHKLKTAKGAVSRIGYAEDGYQGFGFDGRCEYAQWEECPGCEKCNPNDGLVLRQGAWRPTDSHEYIYLLAKTGKYYCDAEAVKELGVATSNRGGNRNMMKANGIVLGCKESPHCGLGDNWQPNGTGRNKRDVWTIKPESNQMGGHYATFPTGLVEPCVLAGTSEKGVCLSCGGPWARVIDYQAHYTKREDAHVPNHAPSKVDSSGWQSPTSNTIGWRPSCRCPDNTPVPAVVMDPFCGTGTTNLVAQKLGRHSVGIDLSEPYLKMAIRRLSGVSLPMAI